MSTNACVNPEVGLSPWVWMAAGLAIGATLLLLLSILAFQRPFNFFFQHFLARQRRSVLPRFIILVRHGESQANVNHKIWQVLPDNLVRLTEKGRAQATAAGERIEQLFAAQDKKSHAVRRIHLVVSPFERTLETAACLRTALAHRVVRTDVESRMYIDMMACRNRYFDRWTGTHISSFIFAIMQTQTGARNGQCSRRRNILSV